MSDDDEEQEEHTQDDGQDEDKDNTIRSYSKKSYFGRSSRDVRLLNTKTVYKLKRPPFNNCRITVEAGKQSLSDSLIRGMKCKVDHKRQYLGISSSVKITALLDKELGKIQGDAAIDLKKNIDKTTFSFNLKATSKNQQLIRASQLLKYWERFRFKYFIEGEGKRGNYNASLGLNLTFKRNITNFSWIPFIARYNEQVAVKATLKSNQQIKPQFCYRGHFVTAQQHRLYLQHKLIYNSSLSNTLTLNCQDSLGILTFNSSVSFENLILKSKQIRLFMQFNRIYRFGVQKRNQDFEFMFQRCRIKSDLLKSVKLYVGNKGFLTCWEGKFKPLNKCDYKINLQIKPQQNIYDAIRAGFEFKFNL